MNEQEHRIDAIATDLKYAIRQLRRFNCQERALEALERVQEALNGLRPAVTAEWTVDEILSREG